jgi:DNA repair protein RadC
MNEQNPHAHSHHGHRQRKKEQFLKSGIEHLPEHEPLEFLLYYAVPRGDTNPIAHALIKKFGSLEKVLNADYDELTKVEGVGANAASLICFTKMFSKLYLQKQAQSELKRLFNSDNLKEFCLSLFIDALDEEIYCLYLSDDLELIAHEKICTGSLGDIDIPIRKITRSILSHNCRRLVVTHNHPAGSCIPSRKDVDSTEELYDIYTRLEIELTDHIIVGRDGAMSMRECGYMDFGLKR